MALAFSKSALALAFSACLATSALAAQGTLSQGSGKPSASDLSKPAATINLGNIAATISVSNASLGSGGTGLRNLAEGAIEVSGVTPPMKRALIYWAVITNGAPTASAASIQLKRGGAGSSFTTIAGTVFGTGGTPCWAGDRITVYRANIPLSIAIGNGLYIVRLLPGANATTAGNSPWAISNPPMVEGASIVLIGTGTSTVAVYDYHLSGKTFFGQLSYRLIAPISVASSPEVLFLNAGADGQIGDDVDAIALTSSEITTLNAHPIAGPGSPANDSDWNGAIAGPLPQLWDNTTHDVTAEANAGSSGTLLPVVLQAPNDCIVPVANALSIHP